MKRTRNVQINHTSNNLKIIEANIEHLDTILEIQKECYTEIAPESRECVLAKITASPTTCFVALIDTTIVAYIISLPATYLSPMFLDSKECQLPNFPDSLYLHDLAVSSKGRGTGAGKALITTTLNLANSLKFEKCFLIAVQESEGYWARYGFKKVASLDPQNKTKLLEYGESAVLMSVTIARSV